MMRRLLLLVLAATVLEFAAFRYLHRDLFSIDAPAAAQAPVADTRQQAEAALARPYLSRHHAEALVAATDRPGLIDLHVAALARLVRDNPGDVSVMLRYADGLRRQGRLDEAARLFARVAEAP
ncbi:MAG: hypothetical protein ACO1TH_05370 [Luteitalea sp.]